MIRHDRYLMSQVFSPVHKEFSVKITKSIVGAGCVAGYRDRAKRKVFVQLE